MPKQSLLLRGHDGYHLHLYAWLPPKDQPVRAAMLLVHGMCETAGRYARFAKEMTRHGIAVYAHDQRGHGFSATQVEELGHVEEHGFQAMLQDILQLQILVREQHPGVPCLLMGHSMGSFLVQRIIQGHAEGFDAFLLSGTTGPRSGAVLSLGKSLAALQRRLQGTRHRSVLMNGLVFGGFNRGFKPARTPFDWLSCDKHEVDLYIQDPHCGMICSTQFYYEFMRMLQELQRPDAYKALPTNTPIYVFSGGQDPVSSSGDGVRKLVNLYNKHGVQDVECKLYPNGRHEILNEINRDEVTKHLVDWLSRKGFIS